MSLSYCGDLVRRHDPDRFLLTLFAPPEKREALWALYAFNFEIARTREVVTDTNLGLIRLQWWRDAIGSGAPGGNPVLDALQDAIAKYNLPKDLFDSLIYAREFDLEDRPPASIEGMINYADFTSTPLMDLSLKILSVTDDAKHVATAYALTGLLRAAPACLRQRRCYLPGDRIPPVEELYEGQGLERLKPVVTDIVNKAETLLSAAPRDRFLRLHVALAKMYLAQIKSADYDVFSPRLTLPPFARAVRLWWAAL